MSPGCAHCYAERDSNRYGLTDLWGEGHAIRFLSDANWRKPLTWARKLPDELGRRPRVFCASMADVFEDLPELVEPRKRLLELMQETDELDWLILTKRPEVMLAWYQEGGWELTANVWLGVSIENQAFTWRADVLRQLPAAIRFLSCEPLLGSLLSSRTPTCSGERDGAGTGVPAPHDRGLPAIPDGGSVPPARVEEGSPPGRKRALLDLAGIDWVIIGGESGGRGSARPMHPEWAREIRDHVLNIPLEPTQGWFPLRPALHFKQWGSWVPAEPCEGGEWKFGDGKPRGWISRAGAFYPNGSPSVPGDAAFMRYAGPSPKAGGKLLDGYEWCEFPEPVAVPA